MLKPSMNELMAKVSNRYLLVNLTAQRARDISEEAEKTGEKLPDKSVKLALDEIADGRVVYRDGPRPEPIPEPEPELEYTRLEPEQQAAGDEAEAEAEEEPAGQDAFALAPEIIYSGTQDSAAFQEFDGQWP